MRICLAAAVFVAACQPAMSSPQTAQVSPAPAQHQPPFNSTTLVPPAQPLVMLGATQVQVQVADTPAARQQGLSGRASLADGTGLVLYWEAPTVVYIWMPDMNFPIDVIFVYRGKVQAIYANAQPCPKDGPCPTFGPDALSDYVVEVPAGSAQKWGLKVGDSAQLLK